MPAKPDRPVQPLHVPRRVQNRIAVRRHVVQRPVSAPASRRVEVREPQLGPVPEPRDSVMIRVQPEGVRVRHLVQVVPRLAPDERARPRVHPEVCPRRVVNHDGRQRFQRRRTTQVHHLHPYRNHRQRFAEGSRQLVHPRPSRRDHRVRRYHPTIRFHPRHPTARRPQPANRRLRQYSRPQSLRLLSVCVRSRHRVGVSRVRLIQRQSQVVRLYAWNYPCRLRRRERVDIHPKLAVHSRVRFRRLSMVFREQQNPARLGESRVPAYRVPEVLEYLPRLHRHPHQGGVEVMLAHHRPRPSAGPASQMPLFDERDPPRTHPRQVHSRASPRDSPAYYNHVRRFIRQLRHSYPLPNKSPLPSWERLPQQIPSPSMEEGFPIVPSPSMEKGFPIVPSPVGRRLPNKSPLPQGEG